jgi:signal transduction histidine kinase
MTHPSAQGSLPEHSLRLAAWKRKLSRSRAAAFILQADFHVVSASGPMRRLGVATGQGVQAWMPVLAGPPAAGEAAAPCLQFQALACEDFLGWIGQIVTPEDTEAARRARSSERQQSDLKQRLAGEVRRRRFLERQILSVSDAEKRRISMDLHDDLGQHLTGAAFRARSLEEALRAGGHPAARECAQLLELINEGIGKTRALSRGLWPATLQGGSLCEALGGLARDLEEVHGVTCTMDAESMRRIAADDAGHHLFRIIQEAATNGIRHGNARHLSVRSESRENRFVVTIQNDGAAATAQHIEGYKSGLGIVSMKLRAEMLGGELAVEPVASGGIAVRVAIPETRALPRKENRP